MHCTMHKNTNNVYDITQIQNSKINREQAMAGRPLQIGLVLIIFAGMRLFKPISYVQRIAN